MQLAFQCLCGEKESCFVSPMFYKASRRVWVRCKDFEKTIKNIKIFERKFGAVNLLSLGKAKLLSSNPSCPWSPVSQVFHGAFFLLLWNEAKQSIIVEPFRKKCAPCFSSHCSFMLKMHSSGTQENTFSSILPVTCPIKIEYIHWVRITSRLRSKLRWKSTGSASRRAILTVKMKHPWVEEGRGYRLEGRAEVTTALTV